MVAKTYKIMWVLRRLAHLTSDRQELVETYCKQIRPLVELAVPYQGTRITKYESNLLERVQKTALHIIYGAKYTTYEEILKSSNLSTLADRSENLISKLAIKTFHNPKLRSWFSIEQKLVNTRSGQHILKEVPWRTKIFGKSTIPVITNIINTSYMENYQEKYCNQCQKIFKSGKNLNKHMKVKHCEDPIIPQYTSAVIF